jgi:Holliday junction resolvase RusA-like endonuclease
MSIVKVEDLMTMESHGYRTLSFGVLAQPQVQQRPKMKWRGLSVPRLYDPSAKEKKAWRKALKVALNELGIDAASPIFTANGQQQPIQVELTFFWPHPEQKDLDNMVKFVLDAYEGLLYGNDKKIYEIQAKKAYSASAWVSAKFTMVTMVFDDVNVAESSEI